MDEILHEVFHPKDRAGKNVLTALQGARAVRLPELTVLSEGLSLLPEVERGRTGYSYLVSSVPVSLNDLAGEIVESESKVEASGGRLGKLAIKAAGDGELLERLVNVREFLRNHYSYSLVTENQMDLDPLENFLFEEKRGHCEFFATAGALMVRELGVESRVAYGWAGGQYFSRDGMFVFRAREAHAWVEVNLKDHGWVVMEPTPPMVLGGGGAPRVADAGENMPGVEEILEDGEAGFSVERELGWLLLWLTLGLAVMSMVMFFMRRKIVDGVAEREVAVGRRKMDYLSLWKREFQRSSELRPGDTLRAQLLEVKDAPDFADELVKYHYGVRYEGKPRMKAVESGFLRKIAVWAERRKK